MTDKHDWESAKATLGMCPSKVWVPLFEVLSSPIVTMSSGRLGTCEAHRVWVENETPGLKGYPRNVFQFTCEQGAYVQWTSEAVTIETYILCDEDNNIPTLSATLARSMDIVLEYSWLCLHNPSIDWIMHDITFRPSVRE